jgi:hypothetical protein
MIEIVFEAKGLEITGTGSGQCHKSKDMSSCLGLDNDVAFEIEINSGGPGSLVFSFASVSKPGPTLVLVDGTERAIAPDASYIAEQLVPGSDENFIMNTPGGEPHVFTVPNFKSISRYLHFWFDVPEEGGVSNATATVRVHARKDF